MEITKLTKVDVSLSKHGRARYISCYINSYGEVIMDNLSASKEEYLNSDEHADKCKYVSKTFHNAGELYTYLLVKLDLRPSELEIELYDEDGSLRFTYSGDCMIIGY